MKAKPLIVTISALGLLCAIARAAQFVGERWRVELARGVGTFDIFVQPAGDSRYVSLLRLDGERPWYGYNLSDGRELRSSESRATVRFLQQHRLAAVRCVLDREHAVVHEAVYCAIAEGLLVVSRFSARPTAPQVSILRFGPKLDVDIQQLTHYAYRDSQNRRHEGPLAQLGERNAYAGVGAWEPNGDLSEGLSPELPYMLLYNPERAISVGVVLPLPEAIWHDVRTFLQLYRGGWNFWYTGFLPLGQPRGERVLLLYLKQCASPDVAERDVPRLCREVRKRILTGSLPAPQVKTVLVAAAALEREASTLETLLANQPVTREGWLALEMLRAARECASWNPAKALELIERGKATLDAR